MHHKTHFDIVVEQERKHLVTSDITNVTMNKTIEKIVTGALPGYKSLKYSNNYF